MNLDPSDPLAVVFIIDTLAIRAREHQWLVDTIEYLDKDREVGYLFNIKFSKALASFHVSSEAHGELIGNLLYFFTISTITYSRFSVKG